MSAWLGVVSADHVARGVGMGIAQTNHGRRSGLARMKAGDWLVYYSPNQRLREPSPVRAFTAIGRIADETMWQADEGDFTPWRRRVDYLTDVRRAPVDELRDVLELTAAPSWGYQLRRGLLPLSDPDLRAIHRAMTGADVALAGGAVPTQSATLW
jgi:EVE domain